MENYLEFLDIIFNALKTVFACDEMYVLVAVLGSIIIVIIKEIGKTKRVQIEQKGETDRTKIAEIGHTERTKMAMIESSNESNNMKDTILGLVPSMPPEELQKQNNSNLVYFSNIVKENAKKTFLENQIENEILSDKNSQNEKDKKSNEKTDSDDDKKVLDFLKKILKKDESNGN